MRHAFLAKLVRWTFGLQTGILRITREALLAVLTRYGPPVYGSGAYVQNFHVREAGHLNIAARRIIGLGLSAYSLES